MIALRITAEGIYGGSGPLEIGKTVTLKSRKDIPAGWKGKYEIIGDSEGMELHIAAEDAADERTRAITEAIAGLDREKDFTKAGQPEVDAINALMPEGAEPVTAAERDAAFPKPKKAD